MLGPAALVLCWLARLFAAWIVVIIHCFKQAAQTAKGDCRPYHAPLLGNGIVGVNLGERVRVGNLAAFLLRNPLIRRVEFFPATAFFFPAVPAVRRVLAPEDGFLCAGWALALPIDEGVLCFFAAA
jgi:hypothetical protein